MRALALQRLRRLAVAFVAVALAAPIAAARAQAPAAEERSGYIVVLKDTVKTPAAVASEHARRFDAEVSFVYTSALKGYAAQATAGAVSEIRNDSRVAYIERDGLVTASQTQDPAVWGLDRIDQRNLPLAGGFSYANTGAGVSAYVIDTGIRIGHTEFGNRASHGYDFVDKDSVADDCDGHGTHVAGTIGGQTYGVAKGASLVAVRVLNCSGSGYTSGVIAGIDWVKANARKPAVANMSLGGGASSAMDTAVRNAIASGVGFAVAAGNGNPGGVAQDACKYSPARVADAMTIGATDRNDRKASWSNYGNCVDWLAPGVGITSAWSTGNDDTATISGTSMATPHVAGVAALYLQSNGGATPKQVRDALYAATTKAVVTSSKTANNHLLYTSW